MKELLKKKDFGLNIFLTGVLEEENRGIVRK